MPATTSSTTTSSTSSPSASGASTADLDGFSSAVDCNDCQPEHPSGRGGHHRERHRRGLRRPRRPEPGPRRRRLPGAGGLQRQQPEDPPRGARDPRQRGRRELRLHRGSVRAAALAGLDELAVRALLHAAARAGRPQRTKGGTGGRPLQRARMPVQGDEDREGAAEPGAGLAAPVLRLGPTARGRAHRGGGDRAGHRWDVRTPLRSSWARCPRPRSCAGTRGRRRVGHADSRPAARARPRALRRLRARRRAPSTSSVRPSSTPPTRATSTRSPSSRRRRRSASRASAAPPSAPA